MSAIQEEYDRFGPWILEISEKDPPPPLFVPALPRREAPLLSIKIPRRVDRRDARAGMALYDYVVNLYEDELLVLQRVGESEVQTHSFAYADVHLLRQSENLLQGNLHLGLPERRFDLPYNTVGKEIMQRLVTLVRARYGARGAVTAVPPHTPVDERGLSFLFAGLLAGERRDHPGWALLAAQPEVAVGRTETALWRRLLFGALDKRLLESLISSDGRELKIVSRGRAYKYRGQAVYGTEVCYVPGGRLRGHTWAVEKGNTAVGVLTLQTAGGPAACRLRWDNTAVGSMIGFLRELAG